MNFSRNPWKCENRSKWKVKVWRGNFKIFAKQHRVRFCYIFFFLQKLCCYKVWKVKKFECMIAIEKGLIELNKYYLFPLPFYLLTWKFQSNLPLQRSDWSSGCFLSWCVLFLYSFIFTYARYSICRTQHIHNPSHTYYQFKIQSKIKLLKKITHILRPIFVWAYLIS